MKPSEASLAVAIRDTCARVAAEAYEDAGVQGLCAEGRFEAAVGAIERLDLPALTAALVPSAPAPGEMQAAKMQQASGARAPTPAPAALAIRRATLADLPAIVAMLADDVLGAGREQLADPLPECYVEAFAAIEADARCELLVGCLDTRVVATLQLDYTTGLSRQGARRATIEGVRVAAGSRSEGIGSAMIEAAIERARQRDCRIVQLVAHRSRTDAQRLYERLGFTPSHLGMTLEL